MSVRELNRLAESDEVRKCCPSVGGPHANAMLRDGAHEKPSFLGFAQSSLSDHTLWPTACIEKKNHDGRRIGGSLTVTQTQLDGP